MAAKRNYHAEQYAAERVFLQAAKEFAAAQDNLVKVGCDEHRQARIEFLQAYDDLKAADANRVAFRGGDKIPHPKFNKYADSSPVQG